MTSSGDDPFTANGTTESLPALKPAPAPQPPEHGEAHGVNLTDFYGYMAGGSYIFTPTRETWPAKSVNARIPPQPVVDKNGQPKLNKDGNPIFMSASQWVDRYRPVEQLTWWPGEPEVIRDRLIQEGGWKSRKGVTVYNLYCPPVIRHGNAEAVMPWINHTMKVYPDDTGHIIRYLAHRVQRPGEKINHVLLLGGEPGIGKDSILEPVKQAIGPWNFQEISPHQMLGRFNGFGKSVILRISEARDMGDVDRFTFHDRLKIYAAAPPDVLRVDEKHIREHPVANVCACILTTNYQTDGIYLPPDDRRHYVTWSRLTKDDFPKGYFPKLYSWYAEGGCSHVAAYLARVDLSDFDPKAPPPKTPAFWDIVNANRAPEDAELADTLDRLGNPPAVTISMITVEADPGFAEFLRDRRNSRPMGHRMTRAGYAVVRNENANDGLWTINSKRQAIYARAELTVQQRHAAVRTFIESRRI